MKIILIGNGLFGSTFVELSEFELIHPTKEELNLLNPNISKLDYKNVDSCIVAAGITSVDYCEMVDSSDVNIVGVKKVLDQLKELNIKPIFLSSDYVFDGKNKNPNKEDFITNPLNEYGRQKESIEEYIINNFKDYMIVRLTKMYSLTKDCFLLKFLSQLKSGSSIKLTIDQLFQPTLVDDVCKVISELIKINYKGIIHIANDENLTMFDIGEMLTEDYDKLIPISVNDIGIAERPKNCILSTDRLKYVLPHFKFTPIECIKQLV